MASSSGASRFPPLSLAVLESGNQPPHHRHSLSPFTLFVPIPSSDQIPTLSPELLLGEMARTSALRRTTQQHGHVMCYSSSWREQSGPWQAEDGERKIPTQAHVFLSLETSGSSAAAGPYGERVTHSTRPPTPAHTHGVGLGGSLPMAPSPLL